MKTSQFSFDLPEELIAQEPAPERGASRLLVLEASGARRHASVADLPDLVPRGSVVVVNDSRVRKARVFGARAGRPVEMLLLRRLQPRLWEAILGGAGRAKPGARIDMPGGVRATLEQPPRGRGPWTVSFDAPVDDAWLDAHGHVPLPPYIRRADTPRDEERYQTAYARVTGSAAAPTAGLHLTPGTLEAFRARGIVVARVTLHVGLGTFLPIRTEHVEDHEMHEEVYDVPAEAPEAIAAARTRGHPVLAVGTTVVRTLESAWDGTRVRSGEGRTRLFIRPGYRFQVVDRMLTNFHTPGSSLLVLVSAFAGRERIMEAYADAVRQRYRFFSFGDAMLIQSRGEHPGEGPSTEGAS